MFTREINPSPNQQVREANVNLIPFVLFPSSKTGNPEENGKQRIEFLKNLS